MNLTASALSAVFGATASVLLAALVRMLAGMRRDVKRFMAEHLWLLASANWSRTTIMKIMRELGIDGDPPPEWPRGKQ